MVLRQLLVAFFVLSVLSSSAFAYDASAYNQALVAARKASARKDWREAERLADAALHAQDRSWPLRAAISEDAVKKLKGHPKAFYELVAVAANAKSQIFVMQDESLTDEERTHIKIQIKAYTDVLVGSGVAVEDAEKISTRVQEQEQLSVLEEYKLGLNFLLGYSTWEDRIYFKTSIPTHALFFSPTAGFALNYTNTFYDWSGGATFGVGDGELKFSNNTYDNHPKVTVVTGFAQGLMQIHDSVAAFGAEVAARSLTVNGHNSDGTAANATTTELSAVAVGRFRFAKLDLKFKGGLILGSPSALWAVEFGYPLYHW